MRPPLTPLPGDPLPPGTDPISTVSSLTIYGQNGDFPEGYLSVEVSSGDSGWDYGTICSDGFTAKDAKVRGLVHLPRCRAACPGMRDDVGCRHLLPEKNTQQLTNHTYSDRNQTAHSLAAQAAAEH